MKSALSIIPFLWAVKPVFAGDDSYKVNAICTSDEMMRYYQTKHAGIWGGSWWQSALIMGSLAELHALDSDYPYKDTYATTYSQAPSFNGYTGFLNEYNDDQGWWANAWLSVYDITQNQDYLNTAINIYNDISKWKSNCGGIYWEKNHPFVSTIASELYISLAAGLANRVSSDQKQAYVDAASSVWDWFTSSGVLGSDNLAVDGMENDTCTTAGHNEKYSYNQGVILTGAVELYKATGENKYLDTATAIVNAVTTPNSQFSWSDGILKDCSQSGGCDVQGDMFKGPLFNGIRALNTYVRSDQWTNWVTTNAKSLWNRDMVVENSACKTGDNLAGPTNHFSEVTQCAALDVLLAAWVITQ